MEYDTERGDAGGLLIPSAYPSYSQGDLNESTLSNPDYHGYDKDCANFVSQVLHAGDIPPVNGEKSTSSWYDDRRPFARPSYTWSEAHTVYAHRRDYS
ncbi:MAG TPA: amidase domain-containing protein [Candidatus Avoscillospira stercorigallinarum]|uniref:Amidase domain-containing protein n=1 Tax=Candidatus Avoscillospira stercorigallinarum TaxID=2840708 RepID=A0A9D0Z6I2_9FIRM|nr:amidase domain-containing protein [Candidatus Avoscillospira stercorigallinarum]